MENEKISQLLNKARLLPATPGVYKMLDKNGKVIYVGKSKALKNRVSQYFQNLDSHNTKTLKMVERVNDFECVFTDTETEALVLENELIKLFSPKFNIRLKDDKSYPYIKLSTSESFPRLTMVRSLQANRTKNDRYFGPYSSSSAVYSIIDTVNKLFKLPTCKQKFPEDFGKKRPCLNFHINKCCGLCMGDISREEYAETVKSVISFLRSDYEGVIKETEIKMMDAAEKLNFEEAAVYRNLINSIKNLRQQQKIVFDDRVERDVFGIFSDELSSCIAITIVREGRIIDNERFVFSGDEILDTDTFAHFLSAYYTKREYVPKEILLPREMNDETVESVKQYLEDAFEKKVKFIYPEKGEMRRAVLMSSENAREYSLHQRHIEEKTDEKLAELAILLGLEVVPEIIEAYDISNSAEQHTTAGMICVKNGKFYKKAYKLFNIKSTVSNDYMSMAEAIDRRLNRYFDEVKEKGLSENWALPDLFLLDGGVGHVSTVREVFKKYELDIPVFGMVKDEHHKTRTLTDGENEISIAHNQRIFNFIYGIQEEIHRFTFTSMDKKRRKSVTHLSIENIKGIGPKKAKILMSHFKSIKNIKSASFDELVAVKGISNKDANEVIKHFQVDDSDA